MLGVVELFRDRDTVDELGVGVVRDTFSDLLFPGTSTLHSRGRYVLFIPWIYQAIERSPRSSADPWKNARRMSPSSSSHTSVASRSRSSAPLGGAIGRWDCLVASAKLEITE